jgi:hypothetical protein
MNLIIWLIVGGVIGWLASMMMKTDNQQDDFLYAVARVDTCSSRPECMIDGIKFELSGPRAAGAGSSMSRSASARRTALEARERTDGTG